MSKLNSKTVLLDIDFTQEDTHKMCQKIYDEIEKTILAVAAKQGLPDVSPDSLKKAYADVIKFMAGYNFSPSHTPNADVTVTVRVSKIMPLE